MAVSRSFSVLLAIAWSRPSDSRASCRKRSLLVRIVSPAMDSKAARSLCSDCSSNARRLASSRAVVSRRTRVPSSSSRSSSMRRDARMCAQANPSSSPKPNATSAVMMMRVVSNLAVLEIRCARSALNN